MSQGKEPRSVAVYRLLLRLFPERFRAEYEQEMEQLFRHMHRDTAGRRSRLFRLWIEALVDLLRSAPRQHLDTLRLDIRYTLRTLYRSPGFTVPAVVILAVGIAANTSVFSLVRAVLFQPLPYQNPDQLVLLWTDLPKIELFRNWLSEPEIIDLRSRATSLSDVALIFSDSVTLTGAGEPERVSVARVSANFLGLLGVEPLLGRDFKPEEEMTNGPAVAILGHGLWLRRFGADPQVINRTVTLNGQAYLVVGVLGSEFQPRFPARSRVNPLLDVWLPYQVNYLEQDRHSHQLTALARMRPGVTVGQTRQELETVSRLLEDEHYETTGFRFGVTGYQEDLSRQHRPALLALWGAVGFVLLIACANIANLILARSSIREQEMAIRVAAGARRSRLFRQILTEGVVLALLGGLAGVLLALAGRPLLLALSPPGIPNLDTITIDVQVLLFVAGVCMAAALIVTLAPALQASRQNAVMTLRSADRSSASSRSVLLRRGLMVAEIALTCVLLIGAGLMLRTFINLTEADPGFDPEGLLTLRVSLPPSAYRAEEVVPFFRHLEERVAALPGVTDAGSTMQLPFGGSSWSGTNTFFDTSLGPGGKTSQHFEVDQRVVTPDFFTTIGARLIAGRHFASGDDHTSRPVSIIDDTLANRLWPGQNPIGKRFANGIEPEDPVYFEIIGVVTHLRQHRLTEDGRSQVYYPHGQRRFRSLSLVIRSNHEDVQPLLNSIRPVLSRMDPQLPLYSIRTMQEYVQRQMAPVRFSLSLLTCFAVAGVLLSALGIFGVISYGVNCRVREIAVRMSLGASPASVIRLALAGGFTVAATGVAVGLLASAFLTTFLENQISGVSHLDTATFAAVALLCLLTAVFAGLIPAVRASRIEPVEALRFE